MVNIDFAFDTKIQHDSLLEFCATQNYRQAGAEVGQAQLKLELEHVFDNLIFKHKRNGLGRDDVASPKIGLIYLLL